jgi:hypothetical protein
MPIPFHLRVAATALAFPLALRESSLVAQEPSPLHVDQTDYQAICIEGKGEDCSYGFTLIARFENQTADTIYVSRCRPRDRTPKYGVDAIDDTTEYAAYAKFWACVGHNFPIVIAPRASRVDTLRLDGPQAFDGRANAPIGKFEGKFQLTYWVRRCRLVQPTCQPVLQRSEAFRVHLVR